MPSASGSPIFWRAFSIICSVAPAGPADAVTARRRFAFGASGLRPLRGAEPEDFYEVINERYERGSVMVTSNRDYQEWPAAFGENPLMASAALDRLAHRAHLITIKGASYRAKERPRQLAKEETQ